MMHVANPAACFLSQHAVVANVNAGQVQDISFKKEVCARLANITKDNHGDYHLAFIDSLR